MHQLWRSQWDKLPLVAGCFDLRLGIHSWGSLEMHILKSSLMMHLDVLYIFRNQPRNWGAMSGYFTLRDETLDGSPDIF